MPRRRLGQPNMPFPNLLGLEGLDFDLAEHGQDQGLRTAPRVSRASSSSCLEEFKICLHRVGDGERPGLASGVVGAGGSTLSRQVLRLPIGEDANAISVAVVVGGGDGFEIIALLAFLVPRHPLTGPAERLAVAKV